MTFLNSIRINNNRTNLLKIKNHLTRIFHFQSPFHTIWSDLKYQTKSDYEESCFIIITFKRMAVQQNIGFKNPWQKQCTRSIGRENAIPVHYWIWLFQIILDKRSWYVRHDSNLRMVGHKALTSQHHADNHYFWFYDLVLKVPVMTQLGLRFKLITSSTANILIIGIRGGFPHVASEPQTNFVMYILGLVKLRLVDPRRKRAPN